jgi:hypothetical protein
MLNKLADGTVQLLVAPFPAELYHYTSNTTPDQTCGSCRHCGMQLERDDLPAHQTNCLDYMLNMHKASNKKTRRAKKKKTRPAGTSKCLDSPTNFLKSKPCPADNAPSSNSQLYTPSSTVTSRQRLYPVLHRRLGDPPSLAADSF